MSIVEISIIMIGKNDEVTGEPTEKMTRAFVCVDRVTSCFDTTDGFIKIYLSGEKEEYKTNTYTLDEFVSIWRGEVATNEYAKGGIIPNRSSASAIVGDSVKTEIERLISGESE
jgi:hypothetical protein